MSLTGTSAPTQFSAPGVYLTEQLLAPPPVSNVISPSTAGFAGEHWRGPMNVAIRCTSWRDFQTYFGGFQLTPIPPLQNTWLPFAVYEFFNNGGTQCYVTRIGSSSTSGQPATVSLQDSSGSTTPQYSLGLQAGFLGTPGSIGTWANGTPLTGTPTPSSVGMYAQIVATGNNSPPGTFTLIIYNGGNGPGNVVETWANLSMAANSIRYAPTILNSTKSGSLYVYATDLGSHATPPLNAPRDSAGIPQPFLGGVDAGSPSTTDKINALTYGGAGSVPNGVFDLVTGVVNMNLPGESTNAVLAQAIQYCTIGPASRPYSFLVIDPPQGSSVSAVINFMQNLQSSANSTFASLYYPWVVSADPSTQALQATRTMPPGGFVLGQYATIDAQTGPWYAPAGLPTNMIGAVGLERPLAPRDLGSLNLANINALRLIPNIGQVCIFGARTLLTQYANVYVPIRRTLNYVEAQLAQLLQFALFQPNNSVLWGTITAACSQFLSGMAGRNAFQGSTPAQQYYVVCNSTNNTPSSIAQGIVNTQVGVALNAPAEFINLTVTQFQATAQTTVTSTF